MDEPGLLVPEDRRVGLELFSPPSGMRLQCAVATSFTLDPMLWAAAALSASLPEGRGDGMEGVAKRPEVALAAAVRQSGRLHVFYDGAHLLARTVQQDELLGRLTAAWDVALHPVRAPGGGYFHPKVWVASFVPEEGPSDDVEGAVLRVAVGSFNLATTSSWEAGVLLEGSPVSDRRRRMDESKELARFLRWLAERARNPDGRAAGFRLASFVERTVFRVLEAAGGEAREAGEPVSFVVGGLPRLSPPWDELSAVVEGSSTVVVFSPFLSGQALERVAEASNEAKRILVTRREAWASLPSEVRRSWSGYEMEPLEPVGEEDVDPEEDVGPTGAELHSGRLHAKVVVAEGEAGTGVIVGSANLTAPAWDGANVEVVARWWWPQVGLVEDLVEQIEEGSPFLPLELQEEEEDDPSTEFDEGWDAEEEGEAYEFLRGVTRALREEASVVCEQLSSRSWRLRLASVPAEARVPGVQVRPVTLDGNEAWKPLRAGASWRLQLDRVTPLFLLEGEDEDAGRRAVQLRTEGDWPDQEARQRAVLERLLREGKVTLEAFVLAVVGDVGALQSSSRGGGNTRMPGRGSRGAGVLERLLRKAATEPDALVRLGKVLDGMHFEADRGVAERAEQLRALVRSLAGAVGGEGGA